MKGCLTVLVVLGAICMLVFGGGVCFLGVKVREFEREIAAAWDVAEATSLGFPFSRPTDRGVDEERLARALLVRSRVALPVLESLHGIDRASQEDPSAWERVKLAVRAVGVTRDALVAVPERLAAELPRAEMGFEEYRYLTEAIHGTLAGADRAGADPRATRLVDRFEGFFRDESGSTEIEIGGRRYDYPALRHRLERDWRNFDPETLRLVLAHEQELADPVAAVIVDILVLQRGERP